MCAPGLLEGEARRLESRILHVRLAADAESVAVFHQRPRMHDGLGCRFLASPQGEEQPLRGDELGGGEDRHVGTAGALEGRVEGRAFVLEPGLHDPRPRPAVFERRQDPARARAGPARGEENFQAHTLRFGRGGHQGQSSEQGVQVVALRAGEYDHAEVRRLRIRPQGDGGGRPCGRFQARLLQPAMQGGAQGTLRPWVGGCDPGSGGLEEGAQVFGHLGGPAQGRGILALGDQQTAPVRPGTGRTLSQVLRGADPHRAGASTRNGGPELGHQAIEQRTVQVHHQGGLDLEQKTDEEGVLQGRPQPVEGGLCAEIHVPEMEPGRVGGQGLASPTHR